jgi:hypothetical protein
MEFKIDGIFSPQDCILPLSASAEDSDMLMNYLVAIADGD